MNAAAARRAKIGAMATKPFEMPITNAVMAGSSPPKSLNIASNVGTTQPSSTAQTASAMANVESG